MAVSRLMYEDGELAGVPALEKRAEVHDAAGQPEAAIALLEEALAVRRKAGAAQTPQCLALIQLLGRHHLDLGNLGPAERYYREAAALMQAQGNAVGYALMFSALTEVNGRLRNGFLRPNAGDAEVVWQPLASAHRAEYGRALVHHALFWLGRNELGEAEAALRKTAEIQTRDIENEAPNALEYLLALAELRVAMGHFPRAETYLKKALAIREKSLGAHHPRTAVVLAQLGEVYAHQARNDAAAQTLERAQQVLGKARGESNRDYMRVVENLGHLELRRGRYPEARAHYQQVLDYQRRTTGESSPEHAAAVRNLGCLHLAQKNYQQAFDTLLPIKGKVPGSHALVAQAAQMLNSKRDGVIHQLEGMAGEQRVLESILSFTSEAQMQMSLAQQSDSLELLVALSALGPEPPSQLGLTLTWVFRRKGMILETLSRFRAAQRQRDSDPALRAKAEQWQQLRQRIANHALTSGADADKAVARWIQEAEALEAELNRAVARESRRGVYDWWDVRKTLPRQSALVEFLRCRHFSYHEAKPAHYVAFVLIPDSGENIPPPALRFVDLGPAAEIDELVTRFRAGITAAPRELRTTSEKELEGELARTGAELHRRLFAPLKKHLHNASLIYLSPDGELHRLPFEALPDDAGKYLVESFRFAYLASGRDLLREKPKPVEGTVVFAGPDYNLNSEGRRAAAEKLKLATTDDAVTLRGSVSVELRGMRWKRLSGATAEAEDIRQTLEKTAFGPVQTYAGAEAIEEAFKRMKPPRVLHLATHGFFLPPAPDESAPAAETGPGAGIARLRRVPNPLLRSGLVLAGANALGEEGAIGEDGWLTAEEISLMNLRGTDLVVLSACETGLGDIRAGEGVFGLRRAFFFAGAGTLVSSLFEVPDAQTREIMSSFYQGIAAKKSKLDALRDAQLEMIRTRRAAHQAAHPFFWASFVVVGDPK